MRIRMSAYFSGPQGTFHRGSVQQVSDEFGQALIDDGSAVALELAPESVAAPAGETQPDLAELVGQPAAAALADAGFQSLAEAQAALESGADLTELPGVGRATVRKLREA